MSRDDWQRRLGPLYGGAVALVHSTSWRWPDDVRDEQRSSAWVVVVGLPIGVLAYLAAAFIKALHLPVAIAALVGLAALSAASAALIEKGVVERISDQVPAVLVLVFATLVRAAAIVSVTPAHWLGVLVATALVGRFTAVFLQAIGDPILDDHAPRSLVATPAPPWLTAALGLAVAAVVTIALGKAGLFAMLLAVASAFVVGIDAQRRDRGLSAPAVATAAAIGELLVLLAATSPREGQTANTLARAAGSLHEPRRSRACLDRPPTPARTSEGYVLETTYRRRPQAPTNGLAPRPRGSARVGARLRWVSSATSRCTRPGVARGSCPSSCRNACRSLEIA